MLLLKIGLFTLAGIGLLAIVLVSYLELNYRTKTSKEPEYTEEEKFYAELLLMKQDLDADAFRTRQAMHQEFERHPKHNDITDL